MIGLIWKFFWIGRLFKRLKSPCRDYQIKVGRGQPCLVLAMHKNTTDNEDPNSLTVVDNRTGKSYTIPINNGHFVNASHFRQIIGPEDKESDSDGACGDPSPAEGLQIYDPAFMNTAVVKSAISFVDGEQGILLYRGYRIEELIENSNYLEVSYLLIYGELPNLVLFAFPSSKHT